MEWEFQPLPPPDLEVVLEDAQRYQEYVKAAPEAAHPYEKHMENEPKDGQLYEKYVDSLMLIHDMLCDFSSTQAQSRFTVEEINQGIQRLLDDPLVKNHPSIRKNALTNYKIAQEIRKEGERVQGIDSAFDVEEGVTNFLDGLMRMYRILRIPGRKLTLS